MRLHWGAIGAAVSVIGIGVGLLRWINKPVGALFVVGGIVILTFGLVFGEAESTSVDSEPEVYVVYEVDLERIRNAPFIVKNDGPGTVHDIQISTVEHSGRALKFPKINFVAAGDEQPVSFDVLESDGQVSPSSREDLLYFLNDKVMGRNFLRMMDAVQAKRGVPSYFRPLVLPFHITFRRLGKPLRTRRHQLIYDPADKTASVRVLHS